MTAINGFAFLEASFESSGKVGQLLFSFQILPNWYILNPKDTVFQPSIEELTYRSTLILQKQK